MFFPIRCMIKIKNNPTSLLILKCRRLGLLGVRPWCIIQCASYDSITGPSGDVLMLLGFISSYTTQGFCIHFYITPTTCVLGWMKSRQCWRTRILHPYPHHTRHRVFDCTGSGPCRHPDLVMLLPWFWRSDALMSVSAAPTRILFYRANIIYNITCNAKDVSTNALQHHELKRLKLVGMRNVCIVG